MKCPRTDLDKTEIDLLKLTLTIVNLLKFPKRDLGKTLLYRLKLTIITLTKLWKFPRQVWIKLHLTLFIKILHW